MLLAQDSITHESSPHAGTLLHFEDHGLKNTYFLDPQWLAKLMADVIRPAAVEEGSPIQNGQSAIYVCLLSLKLLVYQATT
jgi:hypothetical protein